MLIKSIHLSNLRSVLDETLHCEPLTALVGANGSGKSTFLRGLELFFSGTPRVSAEDFYAGDATSAIEIEITFAQLAEEETKRFASYLQDGNLVVVRVLSLADGKLSATYHGSSLQVSDFQAVREATSAAAKKSAYEQLRQIPKYADLQSWKNQADAMTALREWEASHTEDCVRARDDGQFFGFTEVAQGYLGRHTHFIPLPAVRDAAEDAADTKGSPVAQIMDLVVRSALANREDLKRLEEDTNQKYKEIMDPSKLDELHNLGAVLTATLRTYVPSAGVSLNWIEGGGVEIQLPKAEVKLEEDSYPCTVARTGHGLQRAFILTMLQYLAVVQRTAQEKTSAQSVGDGGAPDKGREKARPSLILAIEEPELYQHPNRQRHLANVLRQLTMGAIPGVSASVQVVYATHSPFFVGIDRINQLRLLRKVPNAKRPKITRVSRTTLDRVAEQIWEAQGQQGARFTGESLRARLQTVMTPWANEGFFADVAVLVEGEEDRAAILGVASSVNHDLESEGVSVIPCMGKNNLDRPAMIFKGLGIPTYIIWDNDHKKNNARPEDNRYLLRLLGEEEEDWPVKVSNRFAAFDNTLFSTLRQEIGTDLFDRLMQETQDDLAILRKEQATKNPAVIRQIIEGAKQDGKSSDTIMQVVEQVVALRNRH